jgi:alpha-mannosidase
MRNLRDLAAPLTISLLLASVLAAQTMQPPDITKEPTLFVVPYAHLDTQWRWEFPQTISEYLLKTMRINFDYIDKYPHYVFNWTGANRYRLMKEYFPSDYARVKQYVATGRWFPAGSSMEEGDVNLPSAEGIIRQILYGNTYFRQEFGKASNEYMLPDCFGFPASLPSILAHAGIKGFSTQKLSSAWQPAPKVGGPGSIEETPEGIPFNVGLWIGPDGKSVIAALNPGSYTSQVYTDLSKPAPPPLPPPQLTPEQRAQIPPRFLQQLERPIQIEVDWPKRIDLDGKVTGVYADYHYVGTGDTGGAAQESSIKLLEAIVTQSETILPSLPVPPFLRRFEPELSLPHASRTPIRVGDGPVHVIESSANQLFEAVQPEMTARMPTYRGDLELINHSAGSLTSQAYHKRWIRRNEVLGDAAEKASVAAEWMGARPYPQKRLNDAWTLVMGGHFHDTAAGTATPRAYQFAWNDDIIALNQFADVLTSATEAVVSGMDTSTRGIPVVVYNSLNIPREDLVEADVSFPHGSPRDVRVYDPDGRETPAQLEGNKVIFLAKVQPVAYAVYEVRPAVTPSKRSQLNVTTSSLENARYLVKLDSNGDVSSIYDKSLGRELLSSPIRLAISTDRPRQWPAWNMDFDQEQAEPRAYVSGPAQVRIAEHGPARVSLEVTRSTEGSKFVQTVSLAAGDAGSYVEFHEAVDWRTSAANLKAVFPLTASHRNATYNWDVGTIERPTAFDRQFEVASHRWIDLTDQSGTFGATILTDYKNGSDKRTDNTIRLTLIRTPGLQPGRNGQPPAYSDQASQDWGHHEITFGLAGHPASWREAQTDWLGYRLNDPLMAFESAKHSGPLGRSFSLLQINNPHIRVMALKKAELSDEVILRMVEMDGQPQENVRVSLAGPIASAREVNGQEQPVGPAQVENGILVTSFGPYQPRTFALRLGRAPETLEAIQSQPVPLHYDLAAASNDDNHTEGGGFDGRGNAFPAEMLPREISFNGVNFRLPEAKTAVPDAVIAKGQTIDLPPGHYNRVYILASAIDGDQNAAFRIGNRVANLKIEDWGGFIGQWDTRLWKNEPKRDWAISAHHAVWPPPPNWPKAWQPRYPEDYVGLVPGYVKPATLAWYASHHHTADGLNEPYQYSYIFAYDLDLPANAHTLVLPDNHKVRIFAISVAQENPHVRAAAPLYDTLGRSEPDSAELEASR